MLRTAILHLFLTGIPRFNTIGRPKALEARYKAHWRLPWPDFHWQADNSLQNTRLSPVRARPWRANQKKQGRHMPPCFLLFSKADPFRTDFYSLVSCCLIQVAGRIMALLILSRLVDTFFSRISLTMPPAPKSHNTAYVLPWEEPLHWQSRSSGYSSS